MGNCMKSVQDTQTLPPSHSTIRKKQLPLKQLWLQLLQIKQYSINVLATISNQDYSHPSFLQIQKDIDRTYPRQKQFDILQNKQIFKSILQSIAWYFPRLGYIQGMNFIAGYLVLCNMNKVEAINSFVSLITHPKLLLIGIYQDQFPLVKLYCELFWSIFQEMSPAFSKRIKDLNIPDQLWIFQWFICLFIYSFPRSYLNDILTFIWKEKEFACVRIGLAIMQIIEPFFASSQNNFQDQFIQCVQLIKDDKYVAQKLPLPTLLQKAKSIDKSIFMTHIKKVKIDNKFSKYFKSSEEVQKTMHRTIIQSIQQDRKAYMQELKTGVSASSKKREPSSITIIDYIQQKRLQRFNVKLINSLSYRVQNTSFIKCKKRYSLQDPSQDNLIFTESFIQK